MRMVLFLGSVPWGPTRIVSCVVDAGSARVTAGTVMVARCASCAHAARDQIPNARSMATAAPAANLIAVTFDDRGKRAGAALRAVTSPTACMHTLIFSLTPKTERRRGLKKPGKQRRGTMGQHRHEASGTKAHNGLGHEFGRPSAGRMARTPLGHASEDWLSVCARPSPNVCPVYLAESAGSTPSGFAQECLSQNDRNFLTVVRSRGSCSRRHSKRKEWRSRALANGHLVLASIAKVGASVMNLISA